MNSWHGGKQQSSDTLIVPNSSSMITKAQTLAYFEEQKYFVDDFQIGQNENGDLEIEFQNLK